MTRITSRPAGGASLSSVGNGQVLFSNDGVIGGFGNYDSLTELLSLLGSLSVGGSITGSNLSGTNTGDVTLAGTPDYITISGQVITRGQIDLTTDVTGLLPNSNLANSSVSYGGVSVSLGGSDATPAFDLTDATGLPLTTGVTGTLPVANGGTGRNTSTTAYGLLAAGTTATGAHQTLAAGLTTQILVGGGASAIPAWGTDLPTAVTIGSAYIYRVGGTDVAVADGGTGLSSWTANGILYASGTTTLANSANLTFDGSDLFLSPAANKTLTFSTFTSPIGGDYPSLTPTSDGVHGNLLGVDGAFFVNASRSNNFIEIGPNFFLDSGFWNSVNFTHNLSGTGITSIAAGQFMSSTRSGTVNAYGVGSGDFSIAHYFTSTNEATYSGTEDLLIINAGVFGGTTNAATYNASGDTFTVSNIAFSGSIDDESVITAGTVNVENTVYTAQIVTSASAVDSSTVNILYAMGSIDSSSTHKASIYDNSGFGWFNVVDNAPIRFGSGNTSSGIENAGDVTILYSGTNWDFDIRLATTAIRFNPSQFDTDFEVYGDNGLIFKTDAGAGDISLSAGTDLVLATTTGTKIGTGTTQLLGFYGVTPVDQPATITDPSGGGTQDAEARAAINALIDRLQELGLIA